ncbi:MAG: type II/IV secretion system protein [Candidatus Kerfeldbacteria bacterium]|nr:type II/IV secretion system protein [Candidatus Kerfeldbacteria bacterium]
MDEQRVQFANTTTVGEYLVQNHLLSEREHERLATQSQQTGDSIESLIEQAGVVSEEGLVEARANVYNVPFIDLFGKRVAGETLDLISQELAQNYRMVAFNRRGDEVSIAMVDPANFKALEALEFIARKNRLKLKYFVCSPSGFKYILQQYENLSTEVAEALKGAAVEERLDVRKINIEEKGLEEVTKSAPVSKMVSVILRHAVEGKASDVHIEPVGNETRVRYRVDGILHTSLVLPKNVHPSLVARIKVLCNMKIDETRIPQDGRFNTTIDGHDIDYRVSTLPLITNEKVVMRILDTTSTVLDLGELGFEGRGRQVIVSNIDKSHGMFLITGPTGSGKTTTLYGLLKILNQEGVNIVTLEDPVEYFMKGINQSQIHTEVGMTFANGLRSVLRQDPDIIMVGEIRDNETAGLAVHAALTGHIVLSTLHTNDAFGAIPRLIDMKIEPFLVASSVNVVMAQRLVRRVCEHCKIQTKLPTKLEEEVWREVAKLPKDTIPEGVKLTKPLVVWRGQGCVRCENTEYKGRIAVSEVLEMTDNLRRILTERGGDLIESIRHEFQTQGMFSMRQDGIFKALRGITTIEEVWDATRM